jgi:hypothetical protein
MGLVAERGGGVGVVELCIDQTVMGPSSLLAPRKDLNQALITSVIAQHLDKILANRQVFALHAHVPQARAPTRRG